jgi:hypothetical protein
MSEATPPPTRPPAIHEEAQEEADRAWREIAPIVVQDDWLRIVIQAHAKIENYLTDALAEDR